MSAWQEHVARAGHTLSADELAAHRHYLADARVLVRMLGEIEVRHDGRSLEAGGHFSDEEIAVLRAARLVLEHAMTPMVLLRQAPAAAPVILGGVS